MTIIERPVLFNGEMVKAILEDRKTMTRRVMKRSMPGDISECRLTKDNILYMEHLGGYTTFRPRACPYGTPGDRLWVKETWKIASFMEGDPIEFQYKADGAIAEENISSDCLNYEDWYERVCIQSTDYLIKIGWKYKDGEGCFRWENGKSPLPWKPSMFMPHWASRIMLEITNVRLGQVQEISEDDATKEGCVPYVDPFENTKITNARQGFVQLWNFINEKRGFGWEANPWVWVIEFKRVIP